MKTNYINDDIVTFEVIAPNGIVQSVMTALNEGNISTAVDQFDDHFKFTDHALALEFTEKERFVEFFQKSRELFPDALVDIDSMFQCGDHVIAEWNLTATQKVAYYGSTSMREPISFRGVSIVRIEYGKIIRWSDYYDGAKSRRINLAAFFTEWIDY